MLTDFPSFIDKFKMLNSKSIEDIFLNMQVMRKDLSASVELIESTKKLLNWCVKIQSSKKLEGQFQLLEEIVSEVIKVDLIKVLFFDSKTKTFTTVYQFYEG